jgi:hypothetical protein
MHKQKREAARTRKKSAHFTKKDVSDSTKTHAGQSHPGASQERLKLTLTVPQNFPALLNALAKFHGQTPEQYAVDALCSVMLCDADNFNNAAREILDAVGGAK